MKDGSAGDKTRLPGLCPGSAHPSVIRKQESTKCVTGPAGRKEVREVELTKNST